MAPTAILWIVTALYAAQAAVCVAKSQAPQALILAGYTVANLGLIWSMR